MSGLYARLKGNIMGRVGPSLTLALLNRIHTDRRTGGSEATPTPTLPSEAIKMLTRDKRKEQ